MNDDEFDDLHWPDSYEMNRALRRAHQLRSEHLAMLFASLFRKLSQSARSATARFSRMHRRLVNG